MVNRTLAQAALMRDSLCRAQVLEILGNSRSGMPPCDIYYQMRYQKWVSNAMVRRAVLFLVEAGDVDFEQSRATQKTYFLTGRGPRHGAILVPAATAPRIEVQPANWASALLALSVPSAVVVSSSPCSVPERRRAAAQEVRHGR